MAAAMTEQAYGYRSQPAAPTPVREYEIIVRQEPKQARMCGIGGKADRRPIDPPPIVQLRVFDTYPTDPSNPGTSSTSNQFHHQPQQALNFLQNPYYFMFASLARTESDDELHLLNDGKTRYTTGSVVSSLYHLKDTENGGEDAGFFIFPDLSVRTEGSYRLKLALFELVGSHVQFCKSVYSRAFYVYTAKKFPGMEESTRLSMSLSDQGIKIRIRKDVRSRKRTLDDVIRDAGDRDRGDEDYEEDDGGEYKHGLDDGALAHPQATEGSRLAITSGSADQDVGAGNGATKGRATRRKASTGARFAADVVPAKGGSSRPTKRQRTQGGTVIDLSQNNVSLPHAVAVAALMSPPKRFIGGPEGHMTGGSGGDVQPHNESPSHPGGPKNWDHLPAPTIKGGVPIDVEEHPATKLDPRLKHTLPSGSATPPNGSSNVAGSSAGTTGAAGSAETDNAAGGGTTPVTSSGRNLVQRHARSTSLNQPSTAPPLQVQISGPNPPRALSQHHHQHSSSHGGSSNDGYAPPWAPPPHYSPVQPQGLPPHGQQQLQGPIGHGQPANLASSQHQVAPGYHPSAPRPNPSGMGNIGPSGMGMGMALPPLQIPQQQGRQVSMTMHPMPPPQSHGYTQGYAGGSGEITASPEMMHPSMSMGPPPPPSHGHAPAGYVDPPVRQGMMMSTALQQPYMSPEGPPGPVYSGHGPASMQMQGHIQQYPGHHHTYSHSHPTSQHQHQQQQQQQPPRPSPTTYVHHGHHLSDPHVHAHTHTYDSYGSAGGAGTSSGGPEASPGMLNMGLSPISPARGTPLSAHPPQQQQQEMYPSSTGVGRDPYAQSVSGYPPRHPPQQQQQQQRHSSYEQQHQQHAQGGGHPQPQPGYADVGPPVYGHPQAHGHPQSNTGYPHPHGGDRGWEEE